MVTGTLESLIVYVHVRALHASAGVTVSVMGVPGGPAFGAIATVICPAPAGPINVTTAKIAANNASARRRCRPPNVPRTAWDHRTASPRDEACLWRC